jgi:hypothetical protein
MLFGDKVPKQKIQTRFQYLDPGKGGLSGIRGEIVRERFAKNFYKKNPPNHV